MTAIGRFIAGNYRCCTGFGQETLQRPYTLPKYPLPRWSGYGSQIGIDRVGINTLPSMSRHNGLSLSGFHASPRSP